MSTDNVNLGPKTQLIPMNERGIILSSIEDAYRFATAVVKSGLAPKQFDTPEKVIIAIQWGAEIGLSKMQSLQNIAVVNGRACLWGDALPALVWASGKCADIVERMEGDPESFDYRAYCEVHRHGKATPTIRTYSVSDAKAAGLWRKAGPWTQHPKRMLQFRARAFALRDTFADVLCGMAIAEEAQDMPHRDAEPMQRPENPSKDLLELTLEGKVGVTTDDERSRVCRYIDPDVTSWADIDNDAARTILNKLNAHTQGEAAVPWSSIKRLALA